MLPKNERQVHIRPLAPLPTGLKPEGELPEKVKSLIFDVYGTLFISGSGDIGMMQNQSKNIKSLDRLLADFDIDQTAGNHPSAFFSNH